MALNTWNLIFLKWKLHMKTYKTHQKLVFFGFFAFEWTWFFFQKSSKSSLQFGRRLSSADVKVQQSKSILICVENWNYRDVWDSFSSSSVWMSGVRDHERSLLNVHRHVPYVWWWFTGVKWCGEYVENDVFASILKDILSAHLLIFTRRTHKDKKKLFSSAEKHLLILF